MIWTLTIECIMGMYQQHDCVRVIEIESEASLLDLHDAIQAAVHFDRDHLFEFFGGRNWRNRKVVFEDSYDTGDLFDTYASIPLEDVYPLPKGCKLHYHFDFGDDWYFEVKKNRKKRAGYSQQLRDHQRVGDGLLGHSGLDPDQKQVSPDQPDADVVGQDRDQ